MLSVVAKKRLKKAAVVLFLVSGFLGSFYVAGFDAFWQFNYVDPIATTRDKVDRLGDAIALYKRKSGSYPQRLEDLVSSPAGVSQLMVAMPEDAWHNSFRYQYPGLHNKKSYDLSSAGEDEEFGTEDDLSNFGKETRR